ncbi:hypothetical protein C456_03001 [Haloferax volcanii DSM 14919]|uniref:Uncharacterized protein n=1 Tax=Haloferax lucentense (strain DSM 14919 / JCM 9276 / NCIMB 13854 / Aa 2.2) TaxID=1230452 RepID=M0GYY6_HALL2|nr:hypothetical protein C456_03001 [Haloferax lucentense DSM 14919]
MYDVLFCKFYFNLATFVFDLRCGEWRYLDVESVPLAYLPLSLWEPLITTATEIAKFGRQLFEFPFDLLSLLECLDTLCLLTCVDSCSRLVEFRRQTLTSLFEFLNPLLLHLAELLHFGVSRSRGFLMNLVNESLYTVYYPLLSLVDEVTHLFSPQRRLVTTWRFTGEGSDSEKVPLQSLQRLTRSGVECDHPKELSLILTHSLDTHSKEHDQCGPIVVRSEFGILDLDIASLKPLWNFDFRRLGGQVDSARWRASNRFVQQFL